MCPYYNNLTIGKYMYASSILLSILAYTFKHHYGPRHRNHSMPTRSALPHDVENPQTANQEADPNSQKLPQASSSLEQVTPVGQEGMKERVAEKKEEVQGYYQVLSALGRLGIIMAYFFLCDRWAPF